ncbi:MAG: hypothetical protein Kow0062_17070 [Acidobacteriota bacterium]
MKRHLVDSEFAPEVRQQADQRLADRSGTDNMHDLLGHLRPSGPAIRGVPLYALSPSIGRVHVTAGESPQFDSRSGGILPYGPVREGPAADHRPAVGGVGRQASKAAGRVDWTRTGAV